MPTQEELDADYVPLGPDYEVWRSREELNEYLEELHEVSLP